MLGMASQNGGVSLGTFVVLTHPMLGRNHPTILCWTNFTWVLVSFTCVVIESVTCKYSLRKDHCNQQTLLETEHKKVA